MKILKYAARFILALITTFEKRVLENLPTDWIEERVIVQLEFNRIRNFVSIYTDDNNDNKAQFSAELKNIKQEDLPFALEVLLKRNITKVKDANLQRIAAFLVNPASAGVKIFLDDNPDNDTQLRNYFGAFLSDDANKDAIMEIIILPFLLSKIKDDLTREIIKDLLKDIFESEK